MLRAKVFLILWVVLIATASLLHAEKYIVVDMDAQMAYAHQNDKIVMSGRVSTGKRDHPTPSGYYKILQKKRYHKSNLWPKPNGGAKMDYMLRLTNSGIAMHLGNVPKWAASHGCIRVQSGFAQRLWNWANVGTEVYISGDYPPGH
ncbi:MAG: L,D-transpeptidase family protein [Campylobacterota bacterium]|nr:L,D-transpeptidase family protein [Campylobacterota bacterium]